MRVSRAASYGIRGALLGAVLPVGAVFLTVKIANPSSSQWESGGIVVLYILGYAFLLTPVTALVLGVVGYVLGSCIDGPGREPGESPPAPAGGREGPPPDF